MKVLIIRFSSFGDILQCFPVAQQLKAKGYTEVHWLTRADFAELVRLNPYVDNVIEFSRSEGLFGLFQLAFRLRRKEYDLIYDAHNNLRSNLLGFFLRWGSEFVRRKKFRWRRYLLFNWRINLFGKKIVGQHTYLEPLKLEPAEFLSKKNLRTQNYVALVPGAAWALKQWPLEKWLSLIRQHPETEFVLLGGKTDAICFEIEKQAPAKNVRNLAGKLSLNESVDYVANARAVIANDTGLLHAADLFGVPTVALIGPSAFGYPASKNAKVIEVDLWCKPCSKDGRGKCKNLQYQKCMNDISEDSVSKKLGEILL